MTGDGQIAPGEVLAGKYRVERVLGQGGMGCVVAAHHIQLDEKVALKFLLPSAIASPDATSRFLQEARAAVKIKSEHVARVIDVGQLENGAPYMVMEYLDGCDLSAWLARRGPMPTEQAVDFLLQACEAIAEAHALGIVHRDLKPANLFCVQRPGGQLAIKVLDFGISKMTLPGSTANNLTRTNALVGSPLYMSPEQMQHSKGVDLRTDVWSLGVILFELLCGRPPFEAEAVTELAVKVFTEVAPPLRTLRLDAPPGLEQVLATCLEKDRARRFQSVADLAIALQSFGSPRAATSVERIVSTLQGAGAARSALAASGAAGASGGPLRESAPAMSGGPPRTTAAAWGQTSPGTRSSSKVLVGIVLGVTVLGLAAGAAVFVLRRAPAVAGPAVGSSQPSTTVAVPAAAPPPQAAPVPSAPTAATAPSPAPVPVPSPITAPATPARRAPGTGPVQPSVPPVRPPAAPAPAPPSKNCDPPYFVDSAGDRQYKPECL
jgi:serine/threonine-protein kinase